MLQNPRSIPCLLIPASPAVDQCGRVEPGCCTKRSVTSSVYSLSNRVLTSGGRPS